MTANARINQLLVASFLFLSISLVSTEYVPVYIWESSKSSEIVPALPRISQETFKEIVQEKLDAKSFVVVFAEPNLSSEDFRAVDDSGNKVFSRLSTIKAARSYLPSVNDPIDVLKTTHNSEITQTTIKDFDVDNIKSSVLIVDLDDVQDNEDRNEILKRHDESISTIYKALQEKEGDVFAIYTGYHTSWITPEAVSVPRQTRKVLQATRADEDRAAWVQNGFILYVSDTPFLTIANTRTNLTGHTVTVTNTNNVTAAVRMEAAATSGVLLNFAFAGGYWILNNASLINVNNNNNEIPLRVVNINAPDGFSLQCTNTVFTQRNDSSNTLNLPGMQIQMAKTAITRFGDPLYCVGFTSAPIWSGIFVTAILVMIMAIGLSMMMDIKTMDRFDDPKGKTIQINVSE